MSAFGDHFSGDFADGESAEERLSQEAEELMRQGRYQDAAARYEDLRRLSPTDLWANLGYISALECAGKVGEAEHLLEDAARSHGRSAHVQRFRRMFFERREDRVRAGDARSALRAYQALEDEPPDQLADLYFNQGRYFEAQAELRRLLNEGPLDEDDEPLIASIQARIGACLRQEGRLDEAQEFLTQALDKDSEHHWTLSEMAECERARGHHEAARTAYQRALELQPDDHWCRGHLAQLEHESGNSEQAVALYEGILEDLPNATWALVELAQVVAETHPDRSRNLALQALQEDPSFPWAYAHLGQLARAAGRFEEARHRFGQALSAAPGATWILHELADTCRHMGRLEEALTHLEHARNSDPFDPTTYGFLGDTLRSSGRLKEARAHFAKAVEFDPGYTWAWRELAEINALLDNHDEARAAYDEACRQEPDEPINDGLMAFLLRCQGDHQGALPHLQAATARLPDYPWAQRELVEVHLYHNDAPAAEQQAREALTQLPDFGPLRLLLAESLRRQGRRAEALAEVDSALEREPEIPQLWAMRAELLSTSDPATALRCARRAARAEPLPEYRLLLAQILAASGRYKEAHKDAREVTREHPQAIAGWLLLSELAERRGDLRAAQAAVAVGHRHNPDDWRLRLRLARLEWQRQQGAGLQRLDDLFAEPLASGIPWREAALLLAHAERAQQCHQALTLLLREAGSDDNAIGEAWRTWCECEVLLGHHKEALQAIANGIAHDPDNPALRLLAAALSEQLDQGADAIAHLEHLRTLQAASATTPRGDYRLTLRQLAGVYQRHQHDQQAAALWRELSEDRHDLESLCDAAAFFAAHHDLEQATQWCADGLANASDLSKPSAQRLLHQAALIRHQQSGPAAAAAYLASYDQQLGPDARELWASFALASGDADQANTLLEHLLAEPTTDPSRQLRRQLLRLRALMLAEQPQAARALAEELRQRHPDHEEVAVLGAELLAFQGQWQASITLLSDPQLPSTPSLERSLLGATILLEAEPMAAFWAWMGRCREPLSSQDAPPLLQILRHAWPDLLAAEPLPTLSLDQITSFPPFPRAATRVAQALNHQRQHRLAGALASQVATSQLASTTRQQLRQLWLQAARALVRVPGARRLAWQAAWRARSSLALLRCLFP